MSAQRHVGVSVVTRGRPDTDGDYQEVKIEYGNLVEIQNIHINYNKKKMFEY